MIKTLKRGEILKALRREPLSPGLWAHGDNFSQPPCAVCAVGACVLVALRNGAEPTVGQIEDTAIAWTAGSGFAKGGKAAALVLAREGCHWNALSVLFESGLRGRGTRMATVTDRDRERLCDFVKNHFPRTIDVEVPG